MLKETNYPIANSLHMEILTLEQKTEELRKRLETDRQEKEVYRQEKEAAIQRTDALLVLAEKLRQENEELKAQQALEERSSCCTRFMAVLSSAWQYCLGKNEAIEPVFKQAHDDAQTIESSSSELSITDSISSVSSRKTSPKK